MILSTRPPTWIQKRLARGAIAVLVVLFIVNLMTASQRFIITKEGNTTQYSMTAVGPVISVCMAVITGVLAIVFWLQPGWFHRLASMFLAGFAIWQLFHAPTGLGHRVVVTPDYFFERIGAWYSPVETRVEFSKLDFMHVEQLIQKNGERRTYQLQCYGKDKTNTVQVPINYMIEMALPEILERAAKSGVAIGDGPDGQRIPAELRR